MLSLAWPIVADRLRLPTAFVVEAVAAAHPRTLDSVAQFQEHIGGAEQRASFLQESRVQWASLSPDRLETTTEVVRVHREEGLGAAVDIAQYGTWEAMDAALNTVGLNEDPYGVDPFMHALFHTDSPVRVGVELPVGMILYEGRKHSNLRHDISSVYLVGPGAHLSRRRATCTSLDVHTALEFAEWNFHASIRHQYEQLRGMSFDAPVLFVHKVTSADVVGAYDIESHEEEVILTPFLSIAVIKEEWRLFNETRSPGVTLQRVLYTHVTLPTEMCEICRVVHSASPNDLNR
jgi:hypothetical protein